MYIVSVIQMHAPQARTNVKVYDLCVANYQLDKTFKIIVNYSLTNENCERNYFKESK